MTKELVHSSILVLCIALSFAFPQTRLVQYDIEIAAGLFAILFFARKINAFSRRTRLLESTVFTFIVMVVVNTTGYLQSDFFFLIYFLLFALTLLLEPIIPIIVTLTLMLFYLFNLPAHSSFSQLLPIFSLACMTPFALILGHDYEETLRLEKTIKQQKEDTFLFLSLMLKNHLNHIKKSIDNFLGDRELSDIRKQVHGMEKLIDMFEKEQK